MGKAMPSLPFVTSSVSTTPEREDGDHTESLAGADLRTIGAPQRFIISSDSSHHSSVNVAEAEVDSVVRTSMPIMTSVTTTTPTADPVVIAKEKLVATSSLMSLSAKVRMRAEYNIKEKRRLKSVVDEQTELLKVREKEYESLKARLLVKEAESAEAICLRAEASKFEVVERSLLDEAQVLKERTTTLEKEKSELEIKVADLVASVKVREQEVVDLDAMVHGLETSSAGLQEKVTAYENCIDQLEKFQDDKMKEVNDKFDQLYTDFVEMALHLEEKFYPHLLTTIFGRRWLLTHGMELAKCLNSTEYLSTLGAAIVKVVEKGMQDGHSAGITHGARLRSNKDASVKTIMNLLRLDDTLAEKLGLTESQPHVKQLMVPIHRSPDQTVVGATALSALRDIFIPLAEPLSSVALEGTSGTAPNTTTALSVTFASISSIPPISTDDYEVVHADGQEGVGADANPFPTVDDAKLNIQ
ncbi:hypothetical protein Tco_0670300 [Tanacetum coccineum]